MCKQILKEFKKKFIMIKSLGLMINILIKQKLKSIIFIFSRLAEIKA